MQLIFQNTFFTKSLSSSGKGLVYKSSGDCFMKTVNGEGFLGTLRVYCSQVLPSFGWEICSWFLKNWNHLNWRVFSLAALYKGFLPCWLRMAPWSLTFWLSFEQVQQTPVEIFCLSWVLTLLICVISDTSLLRGNCLVRGKQESNENQAEI